MIEKTKQIITPPSVAPPQPSQLEFSMRQFLKTRIIKVALAVMGSIALLVPVLTLPGLLLLVLPGEVALLGTVYDEFQLIQYIRQYRRLKSGNWEDTHNATELARILSNNIHGSIKDYSR